MNPLRPLTQLLDATASVLKGGLNLITPPDSKKFKAMVWGAAGLMLAKYISPEDPELGRTIGGLSALFITGQTVSDTVGKGKVEAEAEAAKAKVAPKT